MKKTLLHAFSILCLFLFTIGAFSQEKVETSVHLKVIKNGVTETDSMFTIQGGEESDALKKIIHKYAGLKGEMLISQKYAKKAGEKGEKAMVMKHEMAEKHEHADDRDVKKIVIKKGDNEDHMVIMNNEKIVDLKEIDDIEWITVEGDSIHIKHMDDHKVIYIGEGDELDEEMKNKLKDLETIDISKEDDMIIIKSKKGDEDFVWTTVAKEGDDEKKVIKGKRVETFVVTESGEGEETRVKVYTKPAKGEKSSSVVVITGDEGETKVGEDKTLVVKTKKKKGKDDEIEISVSIDDETKGEAAYDIIVMADADEEKSITRKVKVSKNMVEDVLEVVIEIDEHKKAEMEKKKKKEEKK